MKKGISKAISALAGGVTGAIVGGTAVGVRFNKEISKKDRLFNKILSYYFLYNQWLSVHQQGKSLVGYFEDRQYKTIAIYGMKELGERLYDELKDSDITVKYIIDKNADAIDADVDVITPDDDLESVDVIVVTACFYFDGIYNMLSARVDFPVVSLEDILYEV